MNGASHRVSQVVAVGGFGLAFSVVSAGAQTMRDERLDPYPVRTQVGIVTQVRDNAAWVRLPYRVATGARVSFLPFSDGADVIATGTTRFVMPVAPFEAYISDIRVSTKRFRTNPSNDVYVTGSLTQSTFRRGARNFDDPNGAPLSTGFFARVDVAPPAANATPTEPVRALIAALRALGSGEARAVADAAQRALTSDQFSTSEGVPASEAVNYSALVDNLRRFRYITLEEPIVVRLTERLLTLARDRGNLGASVPVDFLRPAREVNRTGLQGGLGGTQTIR